MERDRRRPELEMIDLIYRAALESDQAPKLVELAEQYFDTPEVVHLFKDLGVVAEGSAPRVVDLNLDVNSDTGLQADEPRLPKKGLGSLGTLPVLRDTAAAAESIQNDSGSASEISTLGMRMASETPAAIASQMLLLQVAGSPMGLRDLERLQRLMPHVLRARQIRHWVAQSSQERHVVHDALDALPQGLVLLDAEGGVALVNRAGSAILARQDSLSLRANMLVGGTSAESRVLSRAISDAVEASLAGKPHASKVVTLARRGAARPLQLLVVALKGDRASGWLDPRSHRVAVFFFDPEASPHLRAEVLRGLYGFTETEAKVAQEVVNGLTVEEISGHLGVSVHTVRAHLKAVFRKTGTRRQVEFMKTMLGGVAAIAGGMDALQGRPDDLKSHDSDGRD